MPDRHVAHTVPYPWPYDGCLAAERTAVVICGAQQQIVDASSGVDDVTARLSAVAAAVRARGGQVLWVRHGTGARPARPNVSLPRRDTPGWQLALARDSADDVIDSAGWDACFGSRLDHALRVGGSRFVVLGGFASEITVDSTVRTLNDRGHECLVLTDGCAPLDPQLGARAHHSVTMSGGIFGALGTASDLLDVLTAAVDEIEPNDIPTIPARDRPTPDQTETLV